MEFASKDLTMGQMNAIVKKLGGEEGALRFLRGELVVVDARIKYEIWRTVKLGIHKSCDEYLKALRSANFDVSGMAEYVLKGSRFTCATEVSDVDLVGLSAQELGFEGGATYGQILARAQENGLELCAAEVGPALRLAYSDQWKGGGRAIIPTKTADSPHLLLYYLDGLYTGLTLSGIFSSSERYWVWEMHTWFIFAKAR